MIDIRAQCEEYKRTHPALRNVPLRQLMRELREGCEKGGVPYTESRREHGYWTLERCKEGALKYRTRSAWQKSHGSAYNAALKNGWLDECCAHMDVVQRPPGHWTQERCREDALKYRTRGAWQSGSGSAYNAAHKNGWLDECCQHMTSPQKSRGYWTLERCKQDALRFSTAVEWYAGSGSAYAIAGRNGWLDECCKHMNRKETRPAGYWTLERCREDAMRFTTRKVWQDASRSAYGAARKNGWLDECYAHMERAINPPNHWTFDRCKQDALLFTTRKAWRRGSSAAYSAARKNGWLDECCSHMPSRKANT